MKNIFILTAVFCASITFAQQQAVDSIHWKKSIIVSDDPASNDSTTVADTAGTKPSRPTSYSSQYCRLLKMKDGSWLAGYTISRNKGYRNDPKGGLELQFSLSNDDCLTWQQISIITDPGRDIDNAQMIEMPNGDILLACRSVRWQESYMLPVYKSTDKGKTWEKLSTIDQIQGKPGELGKPDKGVYEPHFYFLNDGRLAVMYANEKHVIENPSYSQIVSEKISPDLGKTWGNEIWVAYTPGQSASRPGMPVWTKMGNCQYIVVYEVCGPEACNIYCKTSEDGFNWPVGLGSRIADEKAAPYVLALKNGDLVVTSNNSQVSVSSDFGRTWKTINNAWSKTWWPSLYEIRENEIGAVNSVPQPEGGDNVQIQLGDIK